MVGPSMLSPDFNMYFSVPGYPPCRLVHVNKTITHHGYHTLTLNCVCTRLKRKSSPFEEKNFIRKFQQERATQSKYIETFLHYKSIELVMPLKIQYIDNQ